MAILLCIEWSANASRQIKYHIFLKTLLTEQMFMCYNTDADRNNPSTPEMFSRE